MHVYLHAITSFSPLLSLNQTDIICNHESKRMVSNTCRKMGGHFHPVGQLYDPEAYVRFFDVLSSFLEFICKFPISYSSSQSVNCIPPIFSRLDLFDLFT